MQRENNTNSGYGKERFPPARHVKIYMNEKGFTEKEVSAFFQTMLLNSWRTQTERTVKNWKQYLFQWQYILKIRLGNQKGNVQKNKKYLPVSPIF